MSFVVSSYRKDLAKDKVNDPYGFHAIKASKTGRSVRVKRRIEKPTIDMESDEDSEDESDYSNESGSDFSDADNSLNTEVDEEEGEDTRENETVKNSGSPSKRQRGGQGGTASKRQKTHSSPSQPKLQFIARVTTLAVTEDTEAEANLAKKNLAGVDLAVVDRIKKALALAAHSGTGEGEARQAMRMASKLMQAHNVSQADIMATENDEQRAKRAGSSIITIRAANGGRVVMETWTQQLAAAMTIFFNTKVYSTTWHDRSKITWTFYGLAEGTVAAVHAFETCHNLIPIWSTQKTEFKGRNAKNVYRVGVADGLVALARQEKKDEDRAAAEAEKERLKKAAEAEKMQREAEIARLKDLSAKEEEDRKRHEAMEIASSNDRKVKMEEVEDSDLLRPRTPATEDVETRRTASPVWQPRGGVDDGDDSDSDDQSDTEVANFLGDDPIDDQMDLDAGLLKAEEKVKMEAERDTKPPPTQPIPELPIKKEEADEEQSQPAGWESTQQLVRFRNDADNIADAYLTNQKIKLGKGRKSKVVEFKDPSAASAYKQGKADARKLDVKRKRIGNTE
ncbi:hypothetical protein BKA62DRAFT_828571 [Auriculariales sp. MPI-PUGE-AT-0066]|nr:hypothetical protein BKA62DRAFT_828571 [Auriculariales sp. MPI-PUGE-AT-0066]